MSNENTVNNEENIIKKNNDIEVTPVVTAFSVLQKIIRHKDPKELESNLQYLAEDRERDDSNLVSLSFKNKMSKAPQPIVKDFKITAEDYTQIFNKLLEIQDTETAEAMRLLYQYMSERKSFNLDRINGRKLLEMGGFKDIRPESIDKVLRLILRYTNITMTTLDPVKTKEIRSRNKKNQSDNIYKNFTVLQVKEFRTREKHDKENKELLLELSDVKFMDGYMDFINEVSRSYLPMKTINKIPKVSAKDKRRYFIGNICDILSALTYKPYIIKKNLLECMDIGGFHNNRWKSEKRKAWKPIEVSLVEARKQKLLDYKWIFREIKEYEAEKDKILIDDKGGIQKVEFKNQKTFVLLDKYYKYIEAVEIERLYITKPKEKRDDKPMDLFSY